MWFAYVENSMSWYDLDIQIVKKFIGMNKRGEKIPPLEDYKSDDKPLQTVDLIQENNVDRFERKIKTTATDKKVKKPNNNNKQENNQLNQNLKMNSLPDQDRNKKLKIQIKLAPQGIKKTNKPNNKKERKFS